MYPRRFQHQLFGANGIKRHLKQRIAAHRGDGDDQSVTERLVVDLVAGGKLKQRRGGGGLLRREFLRRLRFWSALHDAVVARRALTVAAVAARRIRASLVKARVAKAGRALRLQSAVFFAQSAVILMTMLTQSLGQTVRAALVATSRQGLFLLPLLTLLPRVFGLWGLLACQSVSDVISLVFSWLLTRKVFPLSPFTRSSSPRGGDNRPQTAEG